jgi:hypothetical protein
MELFRRIDIWVSSSGTFRISTISSLIGYETLRPENVDDEPLVWEA